MATAEPLRFPLYESRLNSVEWNILVDDFERGLRSPNTRRAYHLAIRQYQEYAGWRLSRELLSDFLNHLREIKASPQRINIVLAAVRGLAKLGHARGIVSTEAVAGMMLVQPDPIPRANHAGSWLSAFELSQLIQLPDRTTVVGVRDRVVIGLLGGCGLRRTESTDLRWDQYQDYFGRKCLVNFMGKGRRRRTVPVPAWLVPDLNLWRKLQLEEHEQQKGKVLSDEKALAQQLLAGYATPRRRVSKKETGGEVWHRGFENPHLVLGGMCNQGVWFIVRRYARKLGWDIQPHDLRRTLAHLMRLAGAELEQIMFTLGHSNLVITQRYLGMQMDFAMGKAAVDLIDLDLQKKLDADCD